MKNQDKDNHITLFEEEVINIYDPTDDFDGSRYTRFSNRDCQRIQDIFQKNGKVTWGDVYAPWLNREKSVNSKNGVSPEVYMLHKTDPNTEMMCFLDESDGFFYWLPKWEQKKTGFWEKLKGIFSVFFAVLSVVPAFADDFYNPEKPMIVPFAVGLSSVNERVGDTEGHDPLTEECGYARLPPSFYTHNGKSLGIIIIHTWGDTFMAYDSRCPVCFYEYKDKDGGKIDPMLPFSECTKCHASADQLKTQGGSQMFRYKFKGHGPTHLDAYTVKVVEKENDTYLYIDNAPNGTYGEWRTQPENQIILKTFKEKYGREYR